MSISHSELAQLTCPACGKDFEAEIWMLVDAAERPDLAQALRDDTLDQAVCPHCGHAGPSGAPLLFHDPERRRVYFAVPAGVPEHAWRERAQELLYLLVGSLPDEARLLYLSDVQVEQEVAGVRRAVLRRSRRVKPSGDVPAPEPATYHAPVAETLPDLASAPEVASAEPPTELLDALQNLLAADTPQEFDSVVQQNPLLLSDAADLLLVQFADQAFAQGEHAVGEALRAARTTLLGKRLATDAETAAVAPVATAVAEHLPAHAIATPGMLSESAYQALLQATTGDALQQAIRDYPVLLEPWIDDALGVRAEAVLNEDNERLAAEIGQRRDALATLRDALSDEARLLTAIETLLAADNEDALAQAITDHPMLLTDAAQQALGTLTSEARARGDTTLAEYAVECRTLLQNVRAELPQ